MRELRRSGGSRCDRAPFDLPECGHRRCAVLPFGKPLIDKLIDRCGGCKQSRHADGYSERGIAGEVTVEFGINRFYEFQCRDHNFRLGAIIRNIH